MRRSSNMKLAVRARTAEDLAVWAKGEADKAMASARFHRDTAEAFGKRARDVEQAWQDLLCALPRDLFGLPVRDMKVAVPLDQPLHIDPPRDIALLPDEWATSGIKDASVRLLSLIALRVKAQPDYLRHNLHVRLIAPGAEFGYGITEDVLRNSSLDQLQQVVLHNMAPLMVREVLGALKRRAA